MVRIVNFMFYFTTIKKWKKICKKIICKFSKLKKKTQGNFKPLAFQAAKEFYNSI